MCIFQDPSTGNTPLHEAVKSRYIKTIRCILAAGSPVNTRNIKDESPLCVALKRGDLNIASELISNGADAIVIAKQSLYASILNYITTLHYRSVHIELNQEVVDKFQSDLVLFLMKIGGVACLQHLSRVSVRQHIHDSHFKRNVASLPLPDSMKGYLLFEDCPLLYYSEDSFFYEFDAGVYEN